MKDLFEKCEKFTDARTVMEMGLYPYFTEISSAQETEVIINGKKVIMLGSNSYLGLTHHPKVMQAAKEAIEKYKTDKPDLRKDKNVYSRSSYSFKIQ